MNEWQTIAWVAGISTTIFGVVWLLVQDVKRSAHARIQRVEHVVDNMVVDCAKKKDDFITTKAFDRFEGHLVSRMDGFNKNIEHLTTRVDDLMLALRNGKENK